MRRSTGNSAFLSLLKSGSAGAFALAAILACSDGTSATREIIRVRVNSIEIIVPDSIKEAIAAEFAGTLMNAPIGVSANVFDSPVASLSSSTCGGNAGPAYTKSRVAFIPEPIPNIAPFPLYEDGIIPDTDVPLGFSFTFYGKAYDKVNVSSNGLLLFGPLPTTLQNGFAKAGFIPSSLDPNNIIAFAWTDWSPHLVQDGIRWETRGTAPRRKFILQFNNVPEFLLANTFGDIKTLGLLMSQVVLSEGTNDITIYTNKLKVVNSNHLVTQGIENESGTLAMFDSVQNVVTGNWGARRVRFFNLTDDAVRFSPVLSVDDVDPVITAPVNVFDYPNDPGLGSAVVAVATPHAEDNCALEGVTSVRSDGKAIDAAYPVGTTTITWTAKDVAGNTATASQSVTVIDWEPPVITFVPANFSVNATSSLGAMVSYAFTAWDNVGVTSLICDPENGSRIAIGPKTVTCSAFDAAGNSASRSFEVNVVDAPAQMTNLLQYLLGLGLPNGTTNPLANELQHALNDPASSISCKKMSDFLNMLMKKSRDIPSEEIAYMTSEARRIRTVMECR
jgi:hypothetical protein